MLPYRDSRLIQIILGIFFVIVLAYAYFEVHNLLYGPRITVTSNSTEVHEQFVVVKGRADHITSLTVDGAPVSLTIDGSFEVPYLLAPGLNRITLNARDSYGHTSSKIVEIVYMPSATSSVSSTTSIPTTTLPTSFIHGTSSSRIAPLLKSTSSAATSSTPTPSTHSGQVAPIAPSH